MSRVEVTEEEYVDVEDYEEYEWAGQSRIRANSYLPGGLAGAGFLTIQRTDEDEVLDVTGDEAGLGPEQYDEKVLFRLRVWRLEINQINAALDPDKRMISPFQTANPRNKTFCMKTPGQGFSMTVTLLKLTKLSI